MSREEENSSADIEERANGHDDMEVEEDTPSKKRMSLGSEGQDFLSTQTPSLPMLLRKKTAQEKEFRSRYPRSTHHHWDAWADTDQTANSKLPDPYKGIIVWAKMPGHSSWPARLATEDERKRLWGDRQPEPSPVQSLDEDAGGLATDNLLLFFLGSHQVGIVRRSSIEPYVARYKDCAGKLSSKVFQLALEEADGEAIRAEFVESKSGCMVCGGTEDPQRTLICDRCNSEAHMKCLNPPITEVPDEDWVCPICVIEAPLTTESMVSDPEYKSWKINRSAGDDEEDGRAARKRNQNWNAEEDKLLLQGMAETNMNFVAIEKLIPNRTAQAIRTRHKFLAKVGRAPSLQDYRKYEGKIPSEILDKYMSLIDRHADFQTKEDQLKKEEQARRLAQLAAQQSLLNKSGLSESIEHFPQVWSAEESSKKKKKKSSATPNISSSPPAGGRDEGAPKRVKMARPSSANAGEVRNGKEKMGQMLKDVFSAAKSTDADLLTRPPKQQNQAHSTRMSSKVLTCFSCELPGATLLCEDPKCSKAFHEFCLGAFPTKVAKWYCPWHCCALCGPPRSDVNPPVPLTVAKRPPASELLGTTRWRLSAVTPEMVIASNNLLLANSANPSTTTTTTTTTIKGDEPVISTSRKMYRCASCPLALCIKHLYAATEVRLKNTGSNNNNNTGAESSDVTIQIGMDRKMFEYFECERCVGLPRLLGDREDSKVRKVHTGLMQHLPQVKMASMLDRFLSEVVNDHLQLLQFAVKRPSKEMVIAVAGEEAVEPLFSLGKQGKPLSLDEIQRKIRLGKYSVVDELNKDLAFLSETLAVLYHASEPRLAEAARSIVHVFKEHYLAHAKEFASLETQSQTEEREFRESIQAYPGLITEEKLYLQGCFPWESYARPGWKDQSLTTARSRLAKFDNMFQYGSPVKDPTLLHGETEAMKIMIQAAMAAKYVHVSDRESDTLTAPLREQVEQLFDEHMDRVRSALMSGAELRQKIMRVMDVVDSLDYDNFDLHDPVLTIGGSRLSEEQKAANRVLKAKLEESKKALELERQARRDLEERLKALEESAQQKN